MAIFVFQSLKYNVLRNDLHSLKNSVDLLTKSVSAIVAKAISPEIEISPSFLSSNTATPGMTSTSNDIPTPLSPELTPSTSMITCSTVTPGPSSTSESDTSFAVQSSPVNSAQVSNWLSSVTAVTPSDSETSDSISNQVNLLRPSPNFNELLKSDELKEILHKSNSRRNFATNLSRVLFDEHTRLTSNVSGRNKKQLNPAIIGYIKSTTFKYYPCMPSDKESEQWNLCIISIDEASRRLKNKPKKVT